MAVSQLAFIVESRVFAHPSVHDATYTILMLTYGYISSERLYVVQWTVLTEAIHALNVWL